MEHNLLKPNLDPGTFAVTYRLPPCDCVVGARIRAPLSRCVIARAMQGPEKRDRSGMPEVYVAQDAYGLQRVLPWL